MVCRILIISISSLAHNHKQVTELMGKISKNAFVIRLKKIINSPTEEFYKFSGWEEGISLFLLPPSKSIKMET